MSDASIQPNSTVADPAGVREFLDLLKPRVMTLVVFTAVAGMVAAPGELHPVLAGIAVLCVAVGAGAAGAINMWYDRDIDAVMRRTARRPIPAGRIAPEEGLAFGLVLTLFAVMTMGLAVNWTAAGLLAGANAFYVFVYTMWLKRRTPQNIVIGGAAGAFPPMIGWAAVTGGVSLESVVLFALIFLWTPPHFWALSLYTDGDYGRAGVPMLPVVSGRRATKWQMLAYTLVLLPLAPAPALLGTAGPLYGAGATVLGLIFVVSAVRVLQDTDGRETAARRMFGYSILYLFLVFAMLILDGAALGAA
ncbi:protoheme IX farnesyltransferase [Limimonas halophila]|uniref:Protoheme IX farnesyltransferase n=1 Tax=Limimonas halophila TaxID=1082479 RepID=A0A1G7V3Z1_9PROT|nr:heme o synthase [Limimonas halophila]SDG54288.1 protoheme IX farnesyltransferase [Limimonas halophila]